MCGTLLNLGLIGLVPVVKIDTPAQALPLGKALIAGSLPVAEITFRTDAAEESIKILSKELPELLVGAGTVLTVEQAEIAAAAGARYIVTPGFNPKVVARCQEIGIPITPGVTSPSQIDQAMEAGLQIVKFFPAEQSGGVAMLKALAGPYGNKISFIPTGGVGIKNVRDYLACPNVYAVGGSWMVPQELINAGEFEKITVLCKEARALSLDFKLKHVGINPMGDGDPVQDAKLLSAILGMPLKESDKALFVGSEFEIMKSAGRGEKGHIAIETLSVERALAWFATFGFKPVEETFKRANGKITFAYLDKPFMGFALHLSAK